MIQAGIQKEKIVDTPKFLPRWFKQEIPDKNQINNMKQLLRNSNLHTVCEEAHCPNIGQCFGRQTAAFMILGDICSRNCRFCAVKSGSPKEVNEEEPRQIASAVKALNLNYVVITSVTRDDLKCGGASQFTKTVLEIRKLMPQTKVELLIPDFSNRLESIKKVVDAAPAVIDHNIETVKRMFHFLRPDADYDRSLLVLKNVKKFGSGVLTKSGFMVGLGETLKEIIGLMRDLIDADCDILTIGQYLAPSKNEEYFKVERFVLPDEFKEYKKIALDMGFKYVMSAPLVRSSYKAGEIIEYLENKVAERFCEA